jgi:hypothetical protein
LEVKTSRAAAVCLSPRNHLQARPWVIDDVCERPPTDQQVENAGLLLHAQEGRYLALGVGIE